MAQDTQTDARREQRGRDVFDMQKQLVEEHMKTLQRWRQGVDLTRTWEARVGQTPHEEVFQDGKARLLHYKAKTEKRFRIPLLIVFSLINRSYVLDLKPGKSIVEKMVEAGFDVYLIDWGVPGKGDQYLTLDDYVNRFMYRMVDFIKEHAEVDQVSILGYCMGGTIAGMFTSLHQDMVKNLILLAAPFDFSQKEGLLYIWADKEHFNVDKLVSAMGNIPPWFLQSSFNMIKPMQNMLDKYVKFFEKIDDEKFVDDFLTLEYWLNDNIPLAGQVYRQFVSDCFHDNLLIQNRMRVGSHRIDLSQITCPVMNIMAKADHLVPPSSSLSVNEKIGSKEKEAIVFPAGHIGLSVSSKAMKELWPQVAEWLGERSEPLDQPPQKAVQAASPNVSQSQQKSVPAKAKTQPSAKTGRNKR
jgi:polyhydroxyalkanoate synthase